MHAGLRRAKSLEFWCWRLLTISMKREISWLTNRIWREALSLDLVLNRGGQGRDLGGWKGLREDAVPVPLRVDPDGDLHRRRFELGRDTLLVTHSVVNSTV